MRKLIALTLAAAVSGCLSEEIETSELESALSADGWTNDQQISSHYSPYQVGVATYANRLYVAFRRSDSTNIRLSSFDGNQWVGSQVSLLQADYGPALTAYGTGMMTVYKAAGQNRLLMARSSGNGFGSPEPAGWSSTTSITYRYAPAAATLGTDLHIAYCYSDSWGHKAAVDRLSNSTWQRIATRPLADSECKSVALGPSGDGRLVWIVTTYYDTWDTSAKWRMYDAFIDADSVSSLRLLGMTSKKPASVTSCGGITHMVHGGNNDPNAIYWTRLVFGRWMQDEPVPSQTSHGGAQLGCRGTRAYLIHNGGTDQLWWSEYVPD